MSNGAFRLSLLDVSFYERPVKLRLPFRFGVVTLTEAPQTFVRARVELEDGREGEGIAAELLVPKWFDKSPQLSNEDNFDQLRRSLAIAKRHMIAAGSDTPFGLSAATEKPHRAECEQIGLNGLILSPLLRALGKDPISFFGDPTFGKLGMVLMDDYLLELVRAGRITKEVALETAQDARGLEARLGAGGAA